LPPFVTRSPTPYAWAAAQAVTATSVALASVVNRAPVPVTLATRPEGSTVPARPVAVAMRVLFFAGSRIAPVRPARRSRLFPAAASGSKASYTPSAASQRSRRRSPKMPTSCPNTLAGVRLIDAPNCALSAASRSSFTASIGLAMKPSAVIA
jgi:hypothetical protein